MSDPVSDDPLLDALVNRVLHGDRAALAEVPRHGGEKMPAGVGPFRDSVGAVGVGEHGEVPVVRDEGIHQLFHSLVVDVVIPRPMHNQQIALQIGGVGKG